MSTPIQPTRLTAIIRNESPLMIHEPCSYRRVTVELTPEQREKLTLRDIGQLGTEQYTQIILEHDTP